MRVKICGVTRMDDARLAAELGAWAIGFVFWPSSPRFVEPDEARRIVESLPPLVSAVGVFVDQPIAHVEAVAAFVRLSAVQLHGAETPEAARALTRRVIKAIPLGPDGPALPLDGWEDALVLLDAHDPVRRGGTGRTIDWEQAARLAAIRPVMLAGGLSPANVGEAVSRVRPAAIDVSSGVEQRPGVKDSRALAALFEAVAAAGAGTREG